jgi:DNA-binding HxlR family transcriptional regulator
MSRNFPDWIKSYMEFRDQSEAPELFNFWTGVSVVAGALQRHVWMDELGFQWTPNFYIFFVAPPGIATKTTTIGAGHSLLREVEGVRFGSQSTTWQALLADMEKAKQVFEHPSSPSGVMQMSAMTIVVGELGTFLKPKDTDLIDNLVSMWDGQIGTHSHSTKTTGQNTVVNPWINVIGCTTPGWMRSNFPAYMIEGGLTSRTIFLFADQKRQLVAYPSRLQQSKAYYEKRERLIEDLRHIEAKVRGQYTLSEAAYEWGEKWYREHWMNRSRDMLDNRYQGYLARKQTHIHKLAMVLTASKTDSLMIEKETLVQAHAIITSTERDMNRVFNMVGMTDTGRASSEILNTMRAYKEIAKKDLYRILISRIEPKALDAAIASLEQVGTIEKIVIIDEGAPKIGYRLLVDEDVPIVQNLGTGS